MVVTCARKPLVDNLTVAANVLLYGTGSLNIDASRIATDTPISCSHQSNNPKVTMGGGWYSDFKGTQTAGRWPANLILSGTDSVTDMDSQSGMVAGCVSVGRRGVPGLYDDAVGMAEQVPSYGDTGGASRFFKQV